MMCLRPCCTPGRHVPQWPNMNREMDANFWIYAAVSIPQAQYSVSINLHQLSHPQGTVNLNQKEISFSWIQSTTLIAGPARPITESGIGFQPASILAAPSACCVWKYCMHWQWLGLTQGGHHSRTLSGIYSIASHHHKLWHWAGLHFQHGWNVLLPWQEYT